MLCHYSEFILQLEIETTNMKRMRLKLTSLISFRIQTTKVIEY